LSGDPFHGPVVTVPRLVGIAELRVAHRQEEQVEGIPPALAGGQALLERGDGVGVVPVAVLRHAEDVQEHRVVRGAEDGRLAEGPLQPGVAGLAVVLADALAGRLLDGAAQPGVGAELLAALDAVDGVDLQKDGQRHHQADARGRLQDGQLGRVVLAGAGFDLGKRRRMVQSQGSSSVRWFSTRRRT
jgi:hypothetical protein